MGAAAFWLPPQTPTVGSASCSLSAAVAQFEFHCLLVWDPWGAQGQSGICCVPSWVLLFLSMEALLIEKLPLSRMWIQHAEVTFLVSWPRPQFCTDRVSSR